MEPFSPLPLLFCPCQWLRTHFRFIHDRGVRKGGGLTLSFLFSRTTRGMSYIGLEQEGEIKGMLPLNGLCSLLS